MTMVAGPNGSGKTTLTRHLAARGIDLGIYINADDIATGFPELPLRNAA
jgi:predicted ABC-type ATPase